MLCTIFLCKFCFLGCGDVGLFWQLWQVMTYAEVRKVCIVCLLLSGWLVFSFGWTPWFENSDHDRFLIALHGSYKFYKNKSTHHTFKSVSGVTNKRAQRAEARATHYCNFLMVIHCHIVEYFSQCTAHFVGLKKQLFRLYFSKSCKCSAPTTLICRVIFYERF